ncbi:MAG: hypothetical protein KF696_06790 [Planctomycetes bacterium]|nr:hypothetical protein [Planctomycetota bacterium]MCW8135262.1 hypothetical protein [Planctomycetota bacterium]
MRLPALTLLLLLPCALGAQDQNARARRILERPDYQGYRIEKRDYAGDPSGEVGSDTGGEATGEDGYSRGGSGWRREKSTPRRSADAAPSRRPQRTERSGGDNSGSSRSGADLGWLGKLVEVVFWIVVIAGAAVALFFIIKALIGLKLKRKPKAEKKRAVRKDKPAAATQEAEAAGEDAGQEFIDALAVARRELEAALRDHDWARAALLRYRIFWLEAGWRGCVEDTDVQTWRDALRMVREVSLRSRVRELLGLIERVRYGRHTPDEGEWQNFSRQLDSIEPREVLR